MRPINISEIRDNQAIVFLIDDDDDGKTRLSPEADETIVQRVFLYYYKLLANTNHIPIDDLLPSDDTEGDLTLFLTKIEERMASSLKQNA